GSAYHVRKVMTDFVCLVGGACSRQGDLDRRAASRPAVQPDVSPGLLHRAVYHGQSQPCSLAHFLSGEERLENSLLGFFIPPPPAIDHREHNRKARNDRG